MNVRETHKSLLFNRKKKFFNAPQFSRAPQKLFNIMFIINNMVSFIYQNNKCSIKVFLKNISNNITLHYEIISMFINFHKKLD